jgi:hypothetical protein
MGVVVVMQYVDFDIYLFLFKFIAKLIHLSPSSSYHPQPLALKVVW